MRDRLMKLIKNSKEGGMRVRKVSSLFIGFAMIFTLLLPMFAPIYAKENKLPTNIQTHKVENEEAAIAAIETETRKESAIVWIEVAAVCIGGAYIIYKFRKKFDEEKG